MTRGVTGRLVLLGILAVVAVAGASLLGPRWLSWDELSRFDEHAAFWKFRVPRTLLAACAGAGLALGGVIFAFWVFKAAFTREAAVGVILVIGLAVNQAILLVDAALVMRRRRDALGVRRSLDAGSVVRAAVDRSGMVVLVTLAALASLLPLAIGTKTTSLFGAIALATAGGTVAGTLGTMFVVPAMLFGRRESKRKRRGWFRWLRFFKFWGREKAEAAAIPAS